jgi:ABC-2 type transport system permease protein
MEVLVSSAKPFEMMMGKLIGIGLVGLTQYLIWAIAAIPIFFGLEAGLAAQGIALNSISASSIFLFVLYFTLGYFLFASLYLIGGALVTDNESGNIVNRFMLALMSAPPVIILPVVQNPGGAIAVALSLIPFFGAGTMILRIGISSPPLWQILLSLTLMTMTIGASLWVAAKVYRAGILIYGKKPSLPEIIRWLRHA